MAEPIVTPEQLDAYLAGDQQAALNAATAAVRAYCGWHVTPEVTETVTLDVDGPTILLPSLHVTEVTSVSVDGDTVDRFEWSQAGILRLTASACGFRKVEVEMTHGLTEAPEVAAIILAASARSIASPSGVVRAQVGQVSETYTQTGFNQSGGVVLLNAEKTILDRYKLPPRP